MNLANKLTVFRIILVPIMVAISIINFQGEFLGIPIEYVLMNIIFIIASITDKLDGHIARSRNQITTFGKFLDPLADKILVLAAMLILVERNTIPSWIPIIVLAREFIVSGYRLVVVEKSGEVIAASIWGKLKTVTQMFGVIFAFVNINNTNVFFAFTSNSMPTFELIINIITTVLLVISTIATVFSGWDYIKDGKKLFKDM